MTQEKLRAKYTLNDLKITRIEAGFNRSQIAEKTGLTLPTIDRIENLCNNVVLANLQKYCKGIGIGLYEYIVINEEFHKKNV